MTNHLRVLAGGVATALVAVGVYASGARDFLPDTIFKGSALTNWRQLGQAEWKAANGEIVATPGSSGGWLVLDKSFQDVQFFTNIRCAADCKAGVLLRAAKTPDGGLSGTFVSLANGDFATYALTLDAQGREVSRTPIKPPPAREGTGRAAPVARGPVLSLKAADWNEVMINLWASTLRSTLNDVAVPVGRLEGVPDFGTIALYAGGTGEVRFKDVAWKDIISVVEPREVTSTHFTRQHVMEFYYGWSGAAADFNHDGILDVACGKFYYLGPDYRDRRIFREDRGYNPALEYSPDMVNFAYDFTGDGWPDILSSEPPSMRALAMYVNPKGESRRWDRYMVLPDITTELVLMKDIDGDGKPEIIYGSAKGYAWAKPDPQNPTAPWVVHHISSDRSPSHALGLGDINGDGRMDFVGPAGWWEQPAAGATQETWTYHEEDFGISAGRLPGGGEIGVYDVNGDGLPDVVTSLVAHGFGLAWFEQKRVGGKISFVRHQFAGDYASKNAGGVTFSEPHATAFADFDGDGILDFVVGKSMWHHLENYNGPDPYGPAVLYVYRTVRNPKAPGGAEFVPELVNNHSGVGSALQVIDLNKDGAPDIITASSRGLFIFWGKPGKWPAAAPGSGTPR
jgi:hypothetical protein